MLVGAEASEVYQAALSFIFQFSDRNSLVLDMTDMAMTCHSRKNDSFSTSSTIYVSYANDAGFRVI